MLIRNATKQSELEVSIASNFLSQIRGLMFSKPKDILFRFNNERKFSFWMLGVSYPIDIAFIDETGEVFQIEKAKPVTLHPKTWKTYKAKKPCRYVLETPNEFVSLGDKLSMT